MVEFGFAAIDRCTVDDVRAAGSHACDKRLGVVCPPAGGGLLDRLQIADQLRVPANAAPDLVGRRLFGVLPVVVGREELPIGGDQVTTDARLLVPQRRLQLARRHAGRQNAVAQLARHPVGTVQQRRTDERTGEHQHTHDEKDECLPSPHRELRRAQRAPRGGHLVVRSMRSTAMSSVSPPRGWASFSAPSTSASTNAGPGRPACERASASRPSSPRR